MLRWILQRVVPLPRLTDFDRYLFIGPHPDDIEVGCAPTVARLTAMGKRVSFLILTDGSVGALDPALSGEPLAALRREEARASAALLGVTDVTFLPFLDGGQYDRRELERAMAAVIADRKPDVLFAPDPDVTSECHPDHLNAGRAAKTMLCMTGFLPLMRRLGIDSSHQVQAIALYYTARPNAYVNVRKTYGKRMEALACHKTQFDDAAKKQIAPYFLLRARCYGLRRFCGKADGYRALMATHAHCMPEMGE